MVQVKRMFSLFIAAFGFLAVISQAQAEEKHTRKELEVLMDPRLKAMALKQDQERDVATTHETTRPAHSAGMNRP